MGDFEPLEGRARQVVIATVATVVIGLVVAIHAVVDASVLGRAIEQPDAVSASRLKLSDTLSGVLFWVWVASWLATAILFLRWLHRAAKNLPALGDEHPRHSPGWSVGSWFVPFVNLVVPKRVVNDLWRAGRPRDDYPWWLNLWWALWLLSFPLGNLGGRGANDTDDLGELQGQDHVDIAAGVVELAAGILLILVVREITRRQRACRDAGPPPSPPPLGPADFVVKPAWTPAPEHLAGTLVAPEHPAAAATATAPTVSAPVAPPPPPPVVAPPSWRPLAGRARWAVAGLALTIVWTLFTAAVDVYGIRSVDASLGGDDSMLDPSNTLDQIAGISGLVVAVMAATLFLVWFGRAVGNLRTLGDRPKHSPEWAVGSWFVPFVQLVVPFQATSDLWRSGHPPRRQPVWLAGWWIVFWISVAAAIASIILWPAPGSDIADYRPAYVRELVSLALDLAAAILAIVVVRSITRRLETRRRAEGLGG